MGSFCWHAIPLMKFLEARRDRLAEEKASESGTTMPLASVSEARSQEKSRGLHLSRLAVRSDKKALKV